MIDFLTEGEAASRLKLKPKTLSRWRWAGKGPRFYRVGGAIRYHIGDLNEFIISGANR